MGGRDVLESSGGIFTQMSNRWHCFISWDPYWFWAPIHGLLCDMNFSQYGSMGTYMVAQGSKSWIYITFSPCLRRHTASLAAPSMGYWGGQKPAEIQRERVYTAWWEACQRNSSQFLKLPYLFSPFFSTHINVLSTPTFCHYFPHLGLSGKGKASLGITPCFLPLPPLHQAKYTHKHRTYILTHHRFQGIVLCLHAKSFLEVVFNPCDL